MRRRASGGRTSRSAAAPSLAACRTPKGALAIAAAAAVGADLAGVDLIADLDRDRWVVLEVNAVPGWRALSRVTGIDVASAVLDALCHETNSSDFLIQY